MATKTYITPSGAVVDEAGQTISGPVNAGGAPVVNTSNLSPTPSPVVTPPPVVPPPVIPPPPPTPTAPDLTPAISDLEAAITKRLGVTSSATQEAKASAPVQAELNDINTQIALHQARSLQRQEEALRRPGATTESANVDANIAARTDAIEAIKLSAIQQGLQGKLALAQQTAKTAAEEEVAKQTADLQTKRQNIINNYDKFTPEQKKRADAALLKLDKDDAFIVQQKENIKAVQGLIVDAYKNAAGNEAAKMAIAKIKDLNSGDSQYVDKALGILGPYLSDPNAARKALDEHNQAVANLAKTNAEIKEKNASLPNITNPEATKYSSTLSVILGSTKLTKEQKSTLIASVNNGEDPFTVIKNQAKNILGTEGKDLTKYEAARDATIQLQDQLNQFYAAGGSTGIFSGNFEKVSNKLGDVSDPKLVDLAVQIAGSLQKYRNAISGTAYSEQEGKDIAAIFPGITKGELLNSTIVKARLKTLESDIDGLYRSALGSGYDTLKLEARKTMPAGEKVRVLGQEYEVGKVYVDGAGKKWTVDASGKWTKQ